MSVREVLTYPEPRLHKVSQPWFPAAHEREQMFQDLSDTMEALGGRGIAAPQIGSQVRCIMISPEGKDYAIMLINPRWVAKGAFSATFNEACLSVPGLTVPVSRRTLVKVRGVTRDGTERTFIFKGIDAACVQHEYDHLDGKLLVPMAKPQADEPDIGGDDSASGGSGRVERVRLATESLYR
jgi:peptide deformylase